MLGDLGVQGFVVEWMLLGYSGVGWLGMSVNLISLEGGTVHKG